MLAHFPNPRPEPILAYLVGYDREVTAYDGPERTILRQGKGNDADEAIHGLWTDVIMDAGLVMERKGCGGKFRRGEMESEDAGKWKWTVKST
jgi:hypothetical protein